MKYENIDKAKAIIADISSLERTIGVAKEFKSNINSNYGFSLYMSLSGGRICTLSLTDSQIEYITTLIINECTEKLEDYKKQLEYL